jgi:hypothetical protein
VESSGQQDHPGSLSTTEQKVPGNRSLRDPNLGGLSLFSVVNKLPVKQNNMKPKG